MNCEKMKYLGTRCLGHLNHHGNNNCGSDKMKLIHCGIKNSINVLLKCPNIPATAKVIPAK